GPSGYGSAGAGSGADGAGRSRRGGGLPICLRLQRRAARVDRPPGGSLDGPWRPRRQAGRRRGCGQAVPPGGRGTPGRSVLVKRGGEMKKTRLILLLCALTAAAWSLPGLEIG